jgi:tetratricopeptide (TPR) repeat protein
MNLPELSFIKDAAAVVRTLFDAPRVVDLHALCSEADALYEQGMYFEAQTYACRAVKLAASTPSGDNATLVRALIVLGKALRCQARYADAEIALAPAISIAGRLGSDRHALICALNEYGELCNVAGWFECGISAYQHALELAQEMYGQSSAAVAAILRSIGKLHDARERESAARNS